MSEEEQEAILWLSFACLRLHGLPSQLPKASFPSQTLARLGMLPFVSWSLRAEPSASKEVKEAYAHSLAANLFRKQQMKHITEVFLEHSIPFRFIKGASSLLHVYSSAIGLRPMSDIDILIRPNDMPRVSMVLRALGYQNKKHKADITQSHICEATFVHKTQKAFSAVDAHRYPDNWPLHSGVSSLAFDRAYSVWRDKLPSTTPVLSILWLLTHRTRDGFRGDLRELLDLREYIRNLSAADWEELLRLAKQLGLAPSLYLAFVQSTYWFRDLSVREQEYLRAIEEQLSSLHRRFLEPVHRRKPDALNDSYPNTTKAPWDLYKTSVISPKLWMPALTAVSLLGFTRLTSRIPWLRSGI